MWRHSSPDQGPYYGSVARWFAPWVGALAVVILVVWIAANSFGGGEPEPVAQREPSPTPTATPEASESPSPTPKASPTKEAKPSPTDTLITKGISLQVLNASPDADADDRVAERLRGLGFNIVTVEDSLSSFSETHVYWANAGAEEAARRLAEKMGWIAEAQPDTLSLSAEVDLHVLVGADEAA